MAKPRFERGEPLAPQALITGTPVPSAGLPTGVVERLETIREHADSAHRKAPTIEERQAVNGERGNAERRLARLLAHPHENPGGSGAGFGLRDDDVRVVEQRRVLDEATIAAQRINNRYERAIAEWQPKSRTFADCETFLKGRPHGTTVTDWAGAEPRLSKGEDTFAAIARLERRCRELRADLHRIASAPFPSTHARQRARELVTSLAERGTPNVSALVEHEAGEIAWPQMSLRAQTFNAQGPLVAITEVPDFAFFVWLHRDQLVKQLDALIAEEADDANALSIAERQTQGRPDCGRSVERRA